MASLLGMTLLASSLLAASLLTTASLQVASLQMERMLAVDLLSGVVILFELDLVEQCWRVKWDISQLVLIATVLSLA